VRGEIDEKRLFMSDFLMKRFSGFTANHLIRYRR